jgi:hypothetical protein
LYSDRGKEFLGKFKSYIESLSIRHFFTKSINKASIAERVNRTLKQKIYRYFTYSKSKNYISVLDKLVKSYNNSYHSSIKMAPSEVNKKNEKIVFSNQYGSLDDTYCEIKFTIGDYVRTAVEKSLFEKGFTQNWSTELYIVKEIIPTIPLKYVIMDLDGEILKKEYYFEEIQLVDKIQFPYDTFKIIDAKKDQVLIEKLNSPSENKKWISKTLLDNEQSKTENTKINKNFKN